MTHPEEGVEVYVGFWARAGASLLDTLLWLLVVTPLLWWIYGSELFDTEAFRAGGWDVVISWLMPAIATILFWVYRSATPGKMAIGARVVDARTGARPSTLQLIGRYLGYYVSATPLGLGLLWIAWDARKQGWHDKLAGTVVVRRSQSTGDVATFESLR